MNPARISIAVLLLLASAVCVSAQSVQFPNELKGYEFFGKGKLKELKLGSSKKADIERIFGHSCENECDYDDEFSMIVQYLTAWDQCMTTKDSRDRKMCPGDNFIGTIFSIWLSPKREQGIEDPSPSIFTERNGMPVADERGNVTSYTSFDDSFGLGYATVCIANVRSQDPKETKVRLMSISYHLTDDFIDEAYTVEYSTRKKELNQ